ncbi:RES domain-containing protein (plasmid) [Cupriavidus sp. P-10]|uniref:RES family NAD+ phosphorylase n=1 Tax=Cupriavidus sp. P-10 TaxID=2027911 RepID=UPI000ED050EA|nr:RES family NAD+ phosphorylase [Cupriavidus sp. P-10]BDB29409.1 RES domain-containing protein [Cupriavidus sp. P-10]
MMTPNIAAPEHIAVTLPPTDLLRQALAGAEILLPAGTRVSRAVRHPAAVIPPYVQRTYRFGPPAEFAGTDGRFSDYWMYAAQDLTTALWESGFCTNDLTLPGTFYIPPDVAKKGLIATFTLQTDIRVLDLHGTALSKLGIYDQIHGDHAWCQWFGLRMLEVLAGFSGDAAPLGFRYPSRKHKSYLALAVQSGSLEVWRRHVDVQVTRFAEMPEFEILRADANYAEPFGGGFSLE